MTTPNPSLTPVELCKSMRAYVKGDTHAYTRVHRRLVPVLRQRISKLVGDPGALEDVVQSALLRAHEARSRFCFEGATDSSVVAWYVAIARNTALDHLRKQSRRTRREAKVGHYDRARWVGDPQQHNPEQQRVVFELRRETTLRVRAALDDLPLADRSLVIEHKVRGRALAELARDEGVRPVTMRVRAHRAYRRFVAALRSTPESLGRTSPSVYDRARCDARPTAASWSLQPQL